MSGDDRTDRIVRLLEGAVVGGGGELPQEHLERMLNLARSGGRVLSRDHFEPGHFTASAFVLSPDRGQLLLILHQKLGLWLQPGGHVEQSDEDLVAAARRELVEETGLEKFSVLSTLYDVDVHRIPEFKGQPAHLHHDVRILFQAETERVLGADDAVVARWFPLQRIVDSTGSLFSGTGTDDSVRRVARRLLERD